MSPLYYDAAPFVHYQQLYATKDGYQIQSSENHYHSDGKLWLRTQEYSAHKIKPMDHYLEQTPTILTERHNQDHLFQRKNKTVVGRVSVVELMSDA